LGLFEKQKKSEFFFCFAPKQKGAVKKKKAVSMKKREMSVKV
jgi:hypothetical protein